MRFLRWNRSLGLVLTLAMLQGITFQAPRVLATDRPDLAACPIVDQVDYERHVTGLLGRLGCNTGSCHGSFQGKNGFRLTLFGYDPARDHHALTREMLGRRIDRLAPENSLLLLKATGQLPHGGGRVLEIGSPEYEVLRSWIASGAPRVPGLGDLERIEVLPREVHLSAGETASITIMAHFADGSKEDITGYCGYASNDDAVAEVDSQALVRALQPGDTVIVVSYRDEVVPVRVLVPLDVSPGDEYPEIPEFNFVDREVLTKLRTLNIIPSELADDAEFLRRLTIDTIGTLPTSEEVRDFLADSDPEKRAKKIEELLEHPMHAALWATKFSDITGNETPALEVPREKHSQMWHDWLRARFAENLPYDELTRRVLTATSREDRAVKAWIKDATKIDEAAKAGFDWDYADRETLDLFWRRQRNPTLDVWGEKVAAAFLGVRLECAQCHKHPFDRWTESDYRAFANIFGQVTHGASPEGKKEIDQENKNRAKEKNQRNRLPNLKELYLSEKPRSLPHPETGGSLAARVLGGPEIPLEKDQDARAALVEWMRDPDNPFFARSFANRVWGHYFGVGIVDPVDDFSLANPPSNPGLLDALAQDFIDSGFDIRHLERTILNSRTYQLTSVSNETNAWDRNNFARSYVRPMMAEAVVDVLHAALDVEKGFGNSIRQGIKAMEVGPTAIADRDMRHVLQIFGRPPRSTACDCDRAMEPALPQVLYLMSDREFLNKLEDKNGRIAKLIKSDLDDDQILEELFLATLSRFPNDDDKARFAEHHELQDDRRGALLDTLWALINTREFILNH